MPEPDRARNGTRWQAGPGSFLADMSSQEEDVLLSGLSQKPEQCFVQCGSDLVHYIAAKAGCKPYAASQSDSMHTCTTQTSPVIPVPMAEMPKARHLEASKAF